MRGVLSNVLSRDEMKEVMAGSGPLNCAHPWVCAHINPMEPDYRCSSFPGYTNCRCTWNPMYACA